MTTNGMISDEWISNEEDLAGFDATTAIGKREDETGTSRTSEGAAREATGNSQEGSGQAQEFSLTTQSDAELAAKEARTNDEKITLLFLASAVQNRIRPAA